MTDRTYYNGETGMSNQDDQTPTIVALLVLGLVIGGAIAFAVSRANARKRRPFIKRVESGLEEGLESTAATVQRLEKEFRELRKRLEHSLGELR